MTALDSFKMCERLTYPDDRTWEQKSPDNWGSTILNYRSTKVKHYLINPTE